MSEETGRLVIAAERGGSITEISAFLSDLENAYLALYIFNRLSRPRRLRRHIPLKMWLDLGYPFRPFDQAGFVPLGVDSLPPNARLTLERVRIESPGFWEFCASLNPLQQIREYLNDRHRRRQDREFREPLEKERLELENECLRLQIKKMNIDYLREYHQLLHELGYSEDDIHHEYWATIGNPLSRLGRHQDTRLIGGAE